MKKCQYKKVYLAIYDIINIWQTREQVIVFPIMKYAIMDFLNFPKAIFLLQILYSFKYMQYLIFISIKNIVKLYSF